MAVTYLPAAGIGGMKTSYLLLALASALPAAAQTAAPTFTSTCHEGGRSSQPRFCETRDLRMDAPTGGQPLTIDGGDNGGISVRGWDGPDVRIRATVQAQGDSEAEAQARVKGIAIATTGSSLHATLPSGTRQAAVSFEVFVPRSLALSLHTQNGGISLAELQGALDFHTQNGGVALADLSGHVTGRAVNGALSIRLAGRQWSGQGLDVATSNGGITWHVPAGYSAQFFTSTDNGGISTTATLPATSRPHSQYREVKATLGAGGQLVKATTTNGGIAIKEG